MPFFEARSSHRHSFVSGAATTIVAGTSTLGHILALRWATANLHLRVNSLEVEFLLGTAFSAPQEVGFSAYVARGYSAAHTGGAALAIGGAGKDGNKLTAATASTLTGSIANAGALTAGTHTLDANPFLRSSVWCGAVGAQLYKAYDADALGPLYLAGSGEGIVILNNELMTAAGIGRWVFSIDYDIGTLVGS